VATTEVDDQVNENNKLLRRVELMQLNRLQFKGDKKEVKLDEFEQVMMKNKINLTRSKKVNFFRRHKVPQCFDLHKYLKYV